MGFKNLRLKLKIFGLRRYLTGKSVNGKKHSWVMPVSHGCHVVEDGSFGVASRELEDPDRVVARREQIEEHELWFFGVFDSRTGDEVSEYMQTHLFDKKLKEMRWRSKETMRKAHLNARAKVREAAEKEEETLELGSATAMVIDGEKIVMANMGEYKVVVCRDGKAYQINRRQQESARRHWSLRFFPGVFRMIKVRLLPRKSDNARAAKPCQSSEIAVGSARIDSDTEFVILASIGIWEVMKHQEAVNLIRHIEDPQEAAECLAKEALIRMSKKNISCLIIRFD